MNIGGIDIPMPILLLLGLIFAYYMVFMKGKVTKKQLNNLKRQEKHLTYQANIEKRKAEIRELKGKNRKSGGGFWDY